MKRRVLAAYGAALLSSVFTQPTFAAEGQSAESASSGIEEITVVARRVEERLQDVPISITAVTPELLEEVSIDNAKDLIKVVPSLFVVQSTSNSVYQFSLRGIRTGVTAYFAEVPSQSAGNEDQMFDLGSVQALAGPQGTLFGRNSTGGAVLFVPQAPTDEFGGFLEGRYGNYNEVMALGVVNVPVNDKLKLRVGGRYYRRDGVVENIYPGKDDPQNINRNSFRASAIFEPNDWISNYLIIHNGRRDEEPLALISADFTPTAGCLSGVICLYGGLVAPLIAQQVALGNRGVSNYIDEFAKEWRAGVTNNLTLTPVEDVTFKYIFGWRRGKNEQFYNGTSLSLPFLIGDTYNSENSFTHEVQVQLDLFDSKLKWTTGGFLADGNSASFSSFQLVQPATANPVFRRNNGNQSESRRSDNSKAVFSQATYAVTDAFNVTGGIRYTKDEVTTVSRSQGLSGSFTGTFVCTVPRAPGTPIPPADQCFQTLNGTWDAMTWTASADYRFNPNLLVYFRTGRGYNAGGFNGAVLGEPGDPRFPGPTYDPEKLTDFELGTKTGFDLGEVQARSNIAIYLSNYNDIQRAQIGNTPDGRPYTAIANATKARIYGLQFESTWKYEDFTLNANYGYLHTEYTVGTPLFPVGNRFAGAPTHTLSLAGTYRHDLAQGGRLVATVDFTYQSSTTTFDQTLGSETLLIQRGYGLLGARLSWQNVMDSQFDLSLYGKNLTDKLYFTGISDLRGTFGFIDRIYAEPRTFGVELRYSF